MMEFDMTFPARLAEIRKKRGITQQTLADLVGLHVVQISRYEGGSSQPTLDIIRKLAVALRVSTDLLIFDKDERNPRDDLKLHFEALSRFDEDEIEVVKAVLEGLIIKHDAQRWTPTKSS